MVLFIVSNIPLNGYTIFCLSVWLILMNMTTISIHVQVSVQPYVFISFGLAPRSGIAGSYVDACFPL